MYNVEGVVLLPLFSVPPQLQWPAGGGALCQAVALLPLPLPDSPFPFQYPNNVIYV